MLTGYRNIPTVVITTRIETIDYFAKPADVEDVETADPGKKTYSLEDPMSTD